jgi:hypothetical protein
VSRYADAAFSAFAELDPIARARRAERLEPLPNPADTATDVCVARIVAVPRTDRSSQCSPPEWRRNAEPSGRGRSRCGVLGLALSAAIAVATTLLWVSPSAGAPSWQAVDAPAHTDRTYLSTLSTRTDLSTRTARGGLTFAEGAPPKVTTTTVLR